jgi:hypothetical protein
VNVQDVLPRDAIPSIDDPEFGSGYFGDPEDEVIVVDGHPVAVTWCPICWSAVVYDRTVEGETLTFGMSGKLADDALVMCDRETGSEWKQPTGTAIAGELDGTRLAVLPAPMVSRERFAADHPGGVVLQPVRGDGTTQSSREIYDMEPYDRYAEGAEFGLYGMRGEGERRSWDREDLDAKTVVLGVETGDDAVGYPVPRIEAAGGVVTDSVGGRSVAVFATDDGVHAFENPGFTFETRGDSTHADGTTWDGATGASADGRELERVPARRLFAFAWQDAHGPDAFHSP